MKIKNSTFKKVKKKKSLFYKVKNYASHDFVGFISTINIFGKAGSSNSRNNYSGHKGLYVFAVTLLLKFGKNEF